MDLSNSLNSECIITTYALNREGGYGHVYVNGKAHNHSRVVYAQHHKLDLKDIEGLYVLHTCHNPACVNPKHLRLGTAKENMQDKVRAGRWKGGQPRKLTPEQVAEIRATGWSAMDAAKSKYGVSRSTIENVLYYKSCYKD